MNNAPEKIWPSNRMRLFYVLLLLAGVVFLTISGQSRPTGRDILAYKCFRCWTGQEGSSWTVTSESVRVLLDGAKPLTNHEYHHGFHRIAGAEIRGILLTKTLRLYFLEVTPDGLGWTAAPLGRTNYFSHDDGLVK